MQELNLKKTLAEARRAAAKDQLDRAIDGYRTVLQHAPDNVQLLMELAELLAGKGNRHEAVDTLLTAAEILSGRGQLKTAVGLYRRVLQLNALLVTAYVRLFEIFKALGMGKEARLFMYGAISIFQKAGFPEDLRNMLERIIEIDADDEQIRLALAETNLKLKRTDVAILHFEASLPLLRKKGLDDLFIRAAEHIIYYRPDNLGLCRELASLYLGRLEGAKAEKLLLFCHQQDPRDIETLNLLVKFFIDEGNEKRAVSLLLQKAAILEEGGNREEALEVCELVLRLDHRNADARQFISNAKKLRPRPSLIPRRLESTSLVPMPSAIVEPNAPSFLEISLVTKMPQPPAGSSAQEVQEIRSPIAILDIAVGETGAAAQPRRSPTAKVPTTVQIQTRVSKPPVAKAPAAVQLPKRESKPPYAEAPAAVQVPKRDLKTPFAMVAPAAQLPKRESKPPAAKVPAAVQVPKRESKPPAVKAEPPKKDQKLAPAREQAMSYVPPLASDSDLDWDKAVDILRTHVGDDAETHYDLGLAYMELEQWGEAIAEFELAGRDPARKAICGYLRGQCHDRMNDILQAIACYKDGLTATEMDEEKEKYLWYELGAAYLKMEETRSALEWFEKINARDPDYRNAKQKVAELKKWIAKVEDKKKRSTLILPALSMAGLPPPMKTLAAVTDVKPPEPQAAHAVAAAAPAAGSHAESDESSSFKAGLALMEKGSWQKAISAFQKAVTDSALRADCYRMIGRCHEGAGDLPIAIIKYKVGLMARRITIDQEINLCLDLSEAYVRAGNFSQSLQYLQKIIAMNPTSPEILKKIAAVRAKIGKATAR